MGYLAVMYREEKEIDRWPDVPNAPNPKFWCHLDILMMKWNGTGNTYWFRGGNEFWSNLPAADVPKHLRLLALLE